MPKTRMTLIVVLLLGINICSGQRVITNYLDHFAHLAKELSLQYGIPAAVILGVSILESGSGTSKKCRQLNNYFGVTGRNNLKKRRSAYKQYATAEDSFIDFCKIVSRKNYYPALKNNMNYSKWLVAMNHGSYAGAKGIWISRITNIIRKQNLSLYDK
jgi:Bax protein